MKGDKKYIWHKIAGSLTELPFGNKEIIEIELEGKRFCISKFGTSLSACTATCPHAGGNMADGSLDKYGNIICPLHGYGFDLHTGRDISGEGYFLKIYPLRTTEEGLFVGIEAGGILGWLK